MSRRSKPPKGKAPEDQETVFEEFLQVVVGSTFTFTLPQTSVDAGAP